MEVGAAKERNRTDVHVKKNKNRNMKGGWGNEMEGVLQRPLRRK